MKASILEICVGKPREIEVSGERVSSGIFKQAVWGTVPLSLLNLQGDEQANLKFHGGREKAVYAYSASHYPYWLAALGRETLEPSQFGQNITVDGLSDDEVRIGDILQLGTATVEVAQPRIPCAKLGVRLGNRDFATQFLLAGRLGYYLYVIEPGELSSGDEMCVIERPAHEITIADLWRTTFTQERDLDVARQAMDFPHIDEGWKKRLRALLKAADS